MDSRRWRQIPENQSHPYHQPYLEVREQGLEVGEDPYRSPHTGWPDATKPVWGIQSVEPRMEIRPDERVLYPHPVDMKGAGLDVGLAWKHDSEVLLPRRESGNVNMNMNRNREIENQMRRGGSMGLGTKANILWWSAFMLGCLVVFGGLGGGVGYAVARKGCACTR